VENYKRKRDLDRHGPCGRLAPLTAFTEPACTALPLPPPFQQRISEGGHNKTGSNITAMMVECENNSPADGIRASSLYEIQHCSNLYKCFHSLPMSQMASIQGIHLTRAMSIDIDIELVAKVLWGWSRADGCNEIDCRGCPKERCITRRASRLGRFFDFYKDITVSWEVSTEHTILPTENDLLRVFRFYEMNLIFPGANWSPRYNFRCQHNRQSLTLSANVY